jgi:hypothetical protein
MGAVVFGALWFSAPRASACSCGPPPSTAQALASAVSVFSGKAIAMALDSNEAYVRVTFQVAGVWKGKDDAFQTYSTLRELCGFPVALGTSYVIYVNELDDGRLIFSECSRSKKFPAAAEDLASLGVPAAPHLTDLETRAREAESRTRALARARAALGDARTLREAALAASDLPERRALAFFRNEGGCGFWGYSFGFASQDRADARALRECENQRGPAVDGPCTLVSADASAAKALPDLRSCLVDGPAVE